jgi:hypothetical protein
VLGFRHMRDMQRTDEEKSKARSEMYGSPMSDNVADVPPGLCICLTETEFEKLDRTSDLEVGDLIHLFAMAKVTSVSKSDTGDGERCRVELGIVALAAEDENDEDGPEGDD